MFFNSITEPSNLHWLDVKESYFNSFRAHMPGFFKAPGGRMIEYEEMKPRNLYKKPYYREADREYIDEETRKFLFRSNEDYRHCKRRLQELKRSLIQVSYLKFLKNTPHSNREVYF